ncbi:uncharacterized protein [Palaemon carinicauda]|uniref:uncharacterized protein n=1 Tax=Palaemon carinicauda TaxID=392227 RepID=UPI0035B6266F
MGNHLSLSKALIIGFDWTSLKVIGHERKVCDSKVRVEVFIKLEEAYLSLTLSPHTPISHPTPSTFHSTYLSPYQLLNKPTFPLPPFTRSTFPLYPHLKQHTFPLQPHLIPSTLIQPTFSLHLHFTLPAHHLTPPTFPLDPQLISKNIPKPHTPHQTYITTPNIAQPTHLSIPSTHRPTHIPIPTTPPPTNIRTPPTPPPTNIRTPPTPPPTNIRTPPTPHP